MADNTIGCGLWNLLKPSFWSPTDASLAPSPTDALIKEATKGSGERPVDGSSREDSPSRVSCQTDSSSSTAFTSLTLTVSDIDSKAVWKALDAFLQSFRGELAKLSNQLKAGTFKSLLLNAQQRDFLQSKIKTLEQLIKAACQVAKAVDSKNDQSSLTQLPGLIREIKTEQKTITFPAIPLISSCFENSPSWRWAQPGCSGRLS